MEADKSDDTELYERLDEILKKIAQIYQDQVEDVEFKNMVKLLNNILTNPTYTNNESMWSKIRRFNTISQIKEYLQSHISDASVQTFGFRLFGNISDHDYGIKLMVDQNVYLSVMNTLQQTQYGKNPIVMAEGFRVIGLIAKKSPYQGSLISKNPCKWCNHVTMALFELHSNADMVENGIMSLSYLFKYNKKEDYILLKGRLELYKDLFEQYAEHREIQFHLLRMFTVLTTEESVSIFIEHGIQDYAISNITKFPDQVELTRSAIQLFEKLSYHQRSLLSYDIGEDDEVFTSHRSNMKRLQQSRIIPILRDILLKQKSEDKCIIFSGLYCLDYLEEYDDCSEEEAVVWSNYMFELLEKHIIGNEKEKNMLEVTCACLAKLHELRDKVAVTDEQCSYLYHTIFQHRDDISIFVGSCGAIAELLPKNPTLAKTLLDKGIHFKVLEVMKDHAGKDDVQYAGCLFMINFQLQLPTDIRIKTSFDPVGILRELSSLFCDLKHGIVVKELCLGAMTLLLRDNSVVLMCKNTPAVYKNILNKAKTYSLISYLNQITLMFVSLLCTQEDVAHTLLYDENGIKTVTGLIRRNHKYKEWVVSGLIAMSALVKGRIDEKQEVEGVAGALNLLLELISSHSADQELMQYVVTTLRSFCVLGHSVKLQIVEMFIPTSLDMFRESTDDKLCYLIYTLWTKLGSKPKAGSKLEHNNQVLSAVLLKAIKHGDAIAVQIFLEMNADVNIPYNDVYPITAAIDSRNPKIVEHVLWQNVDPKQVKIALQQATHDLRDEADPRDEDASTKTDIVGYLLREFGYKSQDQTIDWCNLDLTSIEPEWLFIIMDLNHVHYSNPASHGRKISLASKAADVKKQMMTLRGVEPSSLSVEFELWLGRKEESDDSEVFESECEEAPVIPLESKSGFLDVLHKQLCQKFVLVDKHASYREMKALKDLYGVNVVLNRSSRRIGSLPSRQSSNSLTSINISNNRIASLARLGGCTPVMKKLGGLIELNFNHNKLKQLPHSFGTYMKSVKVLDLSYNVLTTFPLCVMNMPLETLNLADNEISSDTLPSMECNAMPIDGIFCPSLKTLNLSSNAFKSIPLWLKAICPKLEVLLFSNNSIQFLPDQNFGFEELKILNFSKNQITKIPEPFFSLMGNLQDLDISDNQLINVSPSFATHLPTLKKLELSNNRLDGEQVEIIKNLPALTKLNLSNNKISGTSPNLSTFESRSLTELDLSKNVELSQLVIGEDHSLSLEILKINGTKIVVLGQEVGNLKNLVEFDISHTCISNLPLEMGKLVNLQTLKLEGLKDMDIPISIVRKSDIIQYLRQKLKNSKSHYRIKLFVVGLEERGKTSLCNSIIKKRETNQLATVGVVKTDWCYKGGTEPLISIWDFAGQKQFYVTHQCFLSQRGIYLVVFSLQRGVEEIERIKPWLHTIQSRSPNAHVIIVGTHHDKAIEIKVDLEKIKAALHVLTTSDTRSDFYPTIESVHFVNALQRDSAPLSNLRMNIINVAEKAEAIPADARSRVNRRVRIMGEKVPACFMDLEQFVAEAEVLSTHKYFPFPILEREELITQLEQKSFDIKDEDLENAVTFLHECGVMLHYNNFSQGLNKLYFIKPEWLSDTFGKIITIPQVQSWVREGILKKKDMQYLMRNVIENTELIEKLVYIMERFEIVLNLDEDEILIPSQLPEDKPANINPPVGQEYLERIYKMPCIPHGFWPRLITRLALFAPGRDSFKRRVMWSNGVYIESPSHCSEVLYFLVEGIEKCKVRIETTLSKNGSVLLGRIVYHIDTMVREWYQGLLGIDYRGNPKVDYLIPCKHCKQEGHDKPHMFTLQQLIEVSESTDYATCGQHSEHGGTICISDIAPDVLLKDFDDKYLINEADITYSPTDKLGDGTQGTVCTGTYKNTRVAVKVFGSSGRQYDYEEQPHYQLRQECSILRLLEHPSIVQFIGVVLRPRCMVMELAGYGALDTLLKSSRETLSRLFIHRVLIQVSEGLDYLHRLNIIYRDLKPQNILVVSTDLGVHKNVKLADFGVSGLTTDQGLLSFVGTVGYMAPNITGRQLYDSKVDIFSFGILIREILTGKRVLSELQFPKQLAGAFADGRAALDKEYGWYDMRHLLNQCVAPNPGQRPCALDITNKLSRSELLCLKGVHDPFDKADASLREYVVLHKGDQSELWVKVAFANRDTSQSRYNIAVLALTDSKSITQKALIPLDDDVNCLTIYLRNTVFAGGPGGTITVINAQTYRIESKIAIKQKKSDQFSTYFYNILAMICLEEIDPSYLILGLGSGQIKLFTEENMNDKFNSCYKTIDVDKTPITKLAHRKENLLIAAHQVIHVFEIERFQRIYKFDLNLHGTTQNHITKMIVFNHMIWVALHNASIVYVCRTTTNSAGHIESIAIDERKTLDLSVLLPTMKSGAPSDVPAGPQFTIFDQEMFKNVTPFDIRITCMSLCHSGMHLGLGNGMLVQLDTNNYKIKFVARRHLRALRVVAPLFLKDTSVLATFGEGVLDMRGEPIPHAQCCTWSNAIGDETESLSRYLEARKSLTRV